MTVAELIRLEKSSEGIIGVLRFAGALQGFTLERDDTFVKPGCYHCKRFHGSKYPDTFEIIVPGHTAVLFHPGNTEDDTQGCVLLAASVGKLKGRRAILNSGETFRAFLKTTEAINFFLLFIENHF